MQNKVKKMDNLFCVSLFVLFFLIYFSGRDEYYYLPFDMLYYFWERSQKGGRKSFRYDELNPEYIIPKKSGIMIPYLDMLQKDLSERDDV